MKRQWRCRDLIETQYYNLELIAGKPTRGRITTKAICYLCYNDYDIVSQNEIKKTQDVGGENAIPICRKCLNTAVDSNIVVPTTRGNSNYRERGEQKRASRKRLYSRAVDKGLKRPREQS
eukprot:9004588-Ditylum_brightwellii.AAC.1